MITRIALVSVAAVALMACIGAAAEPPQTLGSLELIPKQAVGFIHIPNLKGLEDDLKRFSRETGWEIGHGEQPAVNLLQQWTGIQAGIDPEGSATVGFLNPKEFNQRFSVYILPVSDWDAMLKATAGEEMSPGLYALTGAAGPRFVARRRHEFRPHDGRRGRGRGHRGVALRRDPHPRCRARPDALHQLAETPRYLR